MKWISFVLLATLTVANAALAQDESSVADCFGIDTNYQTDDERAGALLNCVEALATTLIPAGAVMAFDLPNGCPEGWSRFDEGSGRMIVGVGKRVGIDGSFRLLADSNGSVYQTGGAENHTLTVPEMPSHSHDFLGNKVLRGGNHGIGTDLAVGDGANYGNWAPSGSISNAGLSAPHNNMPPYIALYFCRKEQR